MRRIRLIPDTLAPHTLLLVPATLAALFLAAYWTPELVLRLLRNGFDGTALGAPLDELHEYQQRVVLVGCALYGLVRVFPYHPLIRPGYKTWLEQTPWTFRQPLPLGPVELEWRDALALIGLTALGVRVGLHPALPAVVVAFLYLLVLTLCLANRRALAEATLLAFGLPLLGLLVHTPQWALAAAAGLYVVGYTGLRRTFKAFPWRDPKEVHPSLKPPQPSFLGWPLKQLGPLPPRPPTSQFKGFLIAALVAWWLFAILVIAGVPADPQTPFDPREARADVALASLGGLLVALVRFGIYVAGCAPPISTFGRIVTGRLIIPRYDHVLVAPMVTALLAAVTPAALYYVAGLAPAVAIALSAFVVLSAAINLGPSLRSWRLTGGFRHLVPPVRRAGPTQSATAG